MQKAFKSKAGSKKPKAAPKPAEPVLTPAEQALTEWGIAYTKQPDGWLLVEGDLNISKKKLKELPDLTRVRVTGSFDCSHNELTSLKGAPQDVGLHFICYVNKLETLEGAPPEVKGNFWAGRNNLPNLKFSPRKIGISFTCGRNKIKSLEYWPEEVGLNYSCGDNDLASFDHAPAKLGGDFWCLRIPGIKTLEGAPKTFGKLTSDFGTFASWNDIPATLRVSPETLDKIMTGTTVLEEKMHVSKPLRLRMPSRSEWVKILTS